MHELLVLGAAVAHHPLQDTDITDQLFIIGSMRSLKDPWTSVETPPIVERPPVVEKPPASSETPPIVERPLASSKKPRTYWDAMSVDDKAVAL